MQQRVTQQSPVFDSATCDHPRRLCAPELDSEKRRVLRCQCGAVVRAVTQYENEIWIGRRIDMAASALLSGNRARAIELAEGV